ncbi:MFS transporter, partial [Frankia sp. Cpl3]|nr:MFS transporter [Frankia sp. Cpl3]
TGSETVLGTTLLCVSIPRLLFMVIGGVVSDRISRKLVLSCSVFARAAVIAFFSLLLWQGNDSFQPFWVYSVATVFGVVDAFFWPARGSVMPLIVSKEQLPSANSIIETSQQLSMVGGPLLASFLLHAASYPLMFLLVAAAFFGSGLLIMTMRLQPRLQLDGEDPSAQTAEKSSVLSDLREGIWYATKVRILIIFMFT